MLVASDSARSNCPFTVMRSPPATPIRACSTPCASSTSSTTPALQVHAEHPAACGLAEQVGVVGRSAAEPDPDCTAISASATAMPPASTSVRRARARPRAELTHDRGRGRDRVQVDRRQRAAAAVALPGRPLGSRKLGVGGTHEHEPATFDQAHPGRAPLQLVDDPQHTDHRCRVDVAAAGSL